MAEKLLLSVLPLGECASLIFSGHLLKRLGCLREADGESALLLVYYVTLPAVILQTLTRMTLSSQTVCCLIAASIATAFFGILCSWLAFSGRSSRERGVLAGTCAGLSLSTLAYPLIGKLAGINGLAVAVVYGTVSLATAHIICYALVSSGGAAFPEKYRHSDGGEYSGQWKGMMKEGLGVYKYPSGAEYAGEWRENLKDGFGVYTFRDGGAYEGEWADGQREGVGVRTFASGKVKAGRWRDGQLEKPMQLWQCSRASEAAADTAESAKRVTVGPGKLSKAFKALSMQPALWASIIGLYLFFTQPSSERGAMQLLPFSISSVTSALAEAHFTLSLLAFGVSLDARMPHFRQMKDTALVLALRFCPMLLAASFMTFLYPALSPMIAVVAVCCLGPIPRQVAGYARQFQCNETFAVAASRLSELVSLPFMSLLLVASAFSWPEQICPWWLSSEGISSPQPFRLCCLALLCVTLTLVGWTHFMLDPKNRTRMTYNGKQAPDGGAQGSKSQASMGSSDPGGAGPPGSISAAQAQRQCFLSKIEPRRVRGVMRSKTARMLRMPIVRLRTRAAAGHQYYRSRLSQL